MANKQYVVPIEIAPSTGGGGTGTVTSVGTSGIATGGPITTTGTVTVAGSGNTTTAATAAANLAAAAAGNVISTDGSGNVQSSGTLLSSLVGSSAPGGTVLGNNTTSTAAATYTIAPVLGIPGTSTGTVALASSTASGKFTVTAPASAATPTLTLPTTSNVLAGQLAGDGTLFSASLVTASAAGTITLPTPLTQTANTVLAGPLTGSAAAPTFRALVTADIPAGVVIWNNIGSANGGNLTLNNAASPTTFNQTSNVAWTWANTTTATSGTTNSSPVLTLTENYWTGAASALDKWTISAGLAAGTNAVSILQAAHIGSGGNSFFSLASNVTGPQILNNPSFFDFGTNTSWTMNFSDSNGVNTDGSLAFTAAGNLALQSGAGTQLQAVGNLTTQNAAAVVIKNANNFTGTVNQFIANMTGTFAPTSGSGNMIGNRVTTTINQTGSASGNYQVQVLQAVETALLGTAHKFLVCQGGAAGTTVKYEINSAGVVDTYNGIATVSQGMPAEYATVDLTAQSAAISATTIYAVPAGGTGMYRISWNADITTAGTSSVLGGAGGYQVLYTSPTDSVVKTTVSGNSVTSAANTTGTAVSGVIIVYAKASTNIQHQFGYTSTGTTMVYQLHAKIEAM